MRPFQFTENSITAGLAYAFWKSSTSRNMWIALFIWYILTIELLVEFNWWLPILNLAYISGITAAIFVYNTVVNKPFVTGMFLRVIFAGVIIAIANGVIVIVLGIFSLNVIASHFADWLDAIIFNIEIGIVIGLAVGIGIEIAEYLNKKLSEYELELASSDDVVHKTN
jgi:hypothetical protein